MPPVNDLPAQLSASATVALDLESMLLRDLGQNRFSTVSTQSGSQPSFGLPRLRPLQTRRSFRYDVLHDCGDRRLPLFAKQLCITRRRATHPRCRATRSRAPTRAGRRTPSPTRSPATRATTPCCACPSRMRAPPPSTASRSAVEVVAIDAREARGFRHVVLCALEQVEHQGNWPRWIGFRVAGCRHARLSRREK